MSISTLDTTIGGASANSYVTLQNAEDYFDARLNSDVWTNATSDDKNRALIQSTARMNNFNWIGDRVTFTQRLAWPRWGARKADQVSMGYGGGYYFNYADNYLTTEIPQPVKDAQCELALSLLEGEGGGAAGALDSFSTDGVTMKFSSAPANVLPDRVAQLLAGLILGNMLIRS